MIDILKKNGEKIINKKKTIHLQENKLLSSLSLKEIKEEEVKEKENKLIINNFNFINRINEIHKTVDLIIKEKKNKDNKNINEFIEIFDNFTKKKLSLILENEYKKKIKKRLFEKKINDVVKLLLIEFKNMYYNSANNYFYIFENNYLHFFDYDNISIDIKNYLIDKRGDMINYKNKIKNSLKKELFKKSIYDLKINQTMIKKVIHIFKPIFIDEKTTFFFIFFIGSCINNMDFNLFKGNLIFYGTEYSHHFIAFIKYNIYDITKLYIRSLSDIKYKYNTNYDFKTCKLFHILIEDFIDFKKKFKEIKELFIIVCNYFFKTYQEEYLKFNNGPIFFLNQFETNDSLFLYYKDKNINDLNDDNIKAIDIITDFTIFLNTNKLPLNLISKKDIVSLMNKYLPFSNNSKSSFKISLNNFNKEKILENYFESEIIIDANNTINIHQLEFFFELWFKKRNIPYNCLTKMELKLFFEKKKIIFTHNELQNIKLLSFNKRNIALQFKKKYIKSKKNNILTLIDLKVKFDDWYSSEFINYPLFDLNDLKLYFSQVLESNYNFEVFGWVHFNLLILF